MTEEEALDTARKLIEELEAGNHDRAEILLDELGGGTRTKVFVQLGKLTRELHDALNYLGSIEPHIAGWADKEIPDAKERLNHVIKMTEESAHRTLAALELAMPITERIQRDGHTLSERWRRFRQRRMNLDEFGGLCLEIDQYFSSLGPAANRVHDAMSEVLLAQECQDITAQIIGRVIHLVQRVEGSLLELVKLSQPFSGPGPTQRVDLATGVSALAGPAVPGVDEGQTVAGQDEVDELLSSLGF